MLPLSFKKTAIAGAFDFFENQAETPPKPISGYLVGAFNLPRLADLMNKSGYRNTVTHIALTDNSIHELEPSMTFHAEAGKVQMKAKGQPIGDLLLLYYNDSSMLKLERRAVRLIGGNEYGFRLAQLQEFIEQQQPQKVSPHEVFEEVASPEPKAPHKQATPENLKLCAGIIAGDAESLGLYFARNRRFLHINLNKYQFDDHTQAEILGIVQFKLAERMLTGKWSYDDKPETMIAFINRCVDNKAVDFLRNQKRHPIVSIEHAEHDDGDHDDLQGRDYIRADLLHPDPSAPPSLSLQDPAEIVAHFDAAAYITALNDYITANPKTPVRHALRYIMASLEDETLTQEAWADSIGLHPGTMKTYMSRARKVLVKKGLGPEALRSGDVHATDSPLRNPDLVRKMEYLF